MVIVGDIGEIRDGDGSSGGENSEKIMCNGGIDEGRRSSSCLLLVVCFVC